jgi:hypothetical protein
LEKFIIPVDYSKVYVSIFIATIGISLGCILEIFEFISDSNSKPNEQRNQHGPVDTDFDLISNVIGSAIAGVASYFLIL